MSIVIIIKVYDVNLNYELKVNILFSIFLLGKNLNILKETQVIFISGLQYFGIVHSWVQYKIKDLILMRGKRL